MQPNRDHLTAGGDAASVTRRALLRSAAGLGAGALASGLALRATPAWAARSRGPQLDDGELRNLFAKTARGLLTPGAVMIVRSPQGDISATYGTGALGRSVPLSFTDRFRIGSVTKTFTGTVILQLAQHGELALTDPVSRFQPRVPNGRHITIEQLLTMHTGLYNYTRSPQLNRAIDAHPRTAFTPRDVLDIAFRERRHPVPGRAFEYCNTNTVLLGLIAEQLDGRPLAEMFRARLFNRLGIRDTLMPAITSSAIPRPHPRGYMYGTNLSTLHSERLPPAQLKAARAGTLKPNDVTVANPSWAGAAGAGISTARDMATWVRGLCDGSLLNRAWQRRRLESVRFSDPKNPAAAGYGYAIARFGALYGHTGEIPGFQTFVGYDPARRLTLVVWTNLNASPEGEAPAATLAQHLIGGIYG